MGSCSVFGPVKEKQPVMFKQVLKNLFFWGGGDLTQSDTSKSVCWISKLKGLENGSVRIVLEGFSIDLTGVGEL